jgi:hypothetical protein
MVRADRKAVSPTSLAKRDAGMLRERALTIRLSVKASPAAAGRSVVSTISYPSGGVTIKRASTARRILDANVPAYRGEMSLAIWIARRI